jgi:hypothetical protein
MHKILANFLVKVHKYEILLAATGDEQFKERERAFLPSLLG